MNSYEADQAVSMDNYRKLAKIEALAYRYGWQGYKETLASFIEKCLNKAQLWDEQIDHLAKLNNEKLETERTRNYPINYNYNYNYNKC